VLHTGGNEDDIDEQLCESNSRSMSPVGDEGNNIRKYKVDMT
jgi:hypothetical protein